MTNTDTPTATDLRDAAARYARQADALYAAGSRRGGFRSATKAKELARQADALDAR